MRLRLLVALFSLYEIWKLSLNLDRKLKFCIDLHFRSAHVVIPRKLLRAVDRPARYACGSSRPIICN